MSSHHRLLVNAWVKGRRIDSHQELNIGRLAREAETDLQIPISRWMMSRVLSECGVQWVSRGRGRPPAEVEDAEPTSVAVPQPERKLAKLLAALAGQYAMDRREDGKSVNIDLMNALFEFGIHIPEAAPKPLEFIEICEAHHDKPRAPDRRQQPGLLIEVQALQEGRRPSGEPSWVAGSLCVQPEVDLS